MHHDIGVVPMAELERVKSNQNHCRSLTRILLYRESRSTTDSYLILILFFAIYYVFVYHQAHYYAIIPK